MQIGSVQNQYINHYHQDGMQVADQKQEYQRAVDNLTQSQQMSYQREQEKRQYQYMAYIMMMQFFAKENMWTMLNQMRIQRTLDLHCLLYTSPSPRDS